MAAGFFVCVSALVFLGVTGQRRRKSPDVGPFEQLSDVELAFSKRGRFGGGGGGGGGSDVFPGAGGSSPSRSEDLSDSDDLSYTDELDAIVNLHPAFEEELNASSPELNVANQPTVHTNPLHGGGQELPLLPPTPPPPPPPPASQQPPPLALAAEATNTAPKLPKPKSRTRKSGSATKRNGARRRGKAKPKLVLSAHDLARGPHQVSAATAVAACQPGIAALGGTAVQHSTGNMSSVHDPSSTGSPYNQMQHMHSHNILQCHIQEQVQMQVQSQLNQMILQGGKQFPGTLNQPAAMPAPVPYPMTNPHQQMMFQQQQQLVQQQMMFQMQQQTPMRAPMLHQQGWGPSLPTMPNGMACGALQPRTESPLARTNKLCAEIMVRACTSWATPVK